MRARSLALRFFTIVVFMMVAFGSFVLRAATFGNEQLDYKVTYKWGLIQKQAGSATLTLKNVGPNYVVKLTAASEPWADRIYMVRDTLNGVIVRNGFRSTFYEKIAHENGEDKHDTVTFGYDGNKVTGECTRRVVKKGQERVNQCIILETEGITVDMLSAFYYMRLLPYNDWQPGHETTVTIFSGKRKEALTIKYHGIEDAKADHKHYSCYHITFIFTSGSGKKTSDDMDAWISADSARIPVRLEGKLPVGKVQCILKD